MNLDLRLFRQLERMPGILDEFQDTTLVQQISKLRIRNHSDILNEKVAIITGASSGIGKATAIALAKEGCKVVLAARGVDKLQNTLTEINQFGGDAIMVKTDVSKKEDCEKLIISTVNQFGKIDILVNNAGISMRARFEEIDLDSFEKLMKINFWGAVYCTRFALPYLLAQKGTVVGISSIAGIAPLPGRTAYSASKHALDGFLNTLRIENLKKGLKVLIMHPGFTASNIRNVALTKDGSLQNFSPRDEGKMMTAEQVAQNIVESIKIGKRNSILTTQGKLAVMAHRAFPALADRLILKEMAKEPGSPV